MSDGEFSYLLKPGHVVFTEADITPDGVVLAMSYESTTGVRGIGAVVVPRELQQLDAEFTESAKYL